MSRPHKSYRMELFGGPPRMYGMDFDEGWTGRFCRAHGARLRELRAERGISRKQLADTAGLNVSQVSRAEAGRDARLSTFLKLYRGLGYDLNLEPREFCEEAGDLLAEEAQRRQDRREDGLLSGKRWR